MPKKKLSDPKPNKALRASQKPEAPDTENIHSPMSKNAAHATESKVAHPLGKTRHGGRGG